MEPPWDRGRKFIQMVQVICCSSWLSSSAGAFSSDFAINLSPQCRAFSRALKTEKLKVPLFPGPLGAGTTKVWRIRRVKNSHVFVTPVKNSSHVWQIRSKLNSLLKSHFCVQHHITYMYIHRHYKIHQTILYRIIRDYIKKTYMNKTWH